MTASSLMKIFKMKIYNLYHNIRFFFFFYISEGLTSSCEIVKGQVFELLSALCLYSTKGLHRALELLTEYKVSRRLQENVTLIPLCRPNLTKIYFVVYRPTVRGSLFYP